MGATCRPRWWGATRARTWQCCEWQRGGWGPPGPPARGGGGGGPSRSGLGAAEPEGPADKAGLLIGDILVGFAGTPVRDTDDLLGLLGQERIGTEQQARVVRGGELRSVPVTVGERQ